VFHTGGAVPNFVLTVGARPDLKEDSHSMRFIAITSLSPIPAPKSMILLSLPDLIYTGFPLTYVNTFSPRIKKVAVRIVGPAPPLPAVKKENSKRSIFSFCDFN
jgi:hypothetical protein